MLQFLLHDAESRISTLLSTARQAFHEATSGLSPIERQIATFASAGVATVVAGGIALSVSRLFRKLDKTPKRVLVTGAGSGLGRATTLHLLRSGDYVIGADIDVASLEALEKQFPNQFISLSINVGDATSVKDAAARIMKHSPNSPRCLDAIINFAGILRGGPLTEMPDAHLAASLQVNVMGTFLVNKYFFPLLDRDDERYQARIINVGSEVSYSQVSAAFNAPYAMTKFAIEGYSASLRQELAFLKNPVFVVVLNPGAHTTEMTAKGTDDLLASMTNGTKFEAQLRKGAVTAKRYIEKHRVDASLLAKKVYQVVHDISPPYRVLSNVSFEMTLAKYTPQWVLDFGLKLMMS